MVHNYRKLKIFEIAHRLTLESYSILHNLPECEDKNLKDQIRRCAVSIPLNIAEGAANSSNKLFFNHLSYAYATAKELSAAILLSRDLGYLDQQAYTRVNDCCETCLAKLYRFLVEIEKRLMERKWHSFFSPKHSKMVEQLKDQNKVYTKRPIN